MKILKITCLFLLSVSISFAQKFEKGTKAVNLGVGYIYGLGVAGSAELGVVDDVSVGVIAGFSRYSFGYAFSNYSSNYLLVGGRGSYHLGTILAGAGIKLDKIDPYIGVSAGFQKYFYGGDLSYYAGRTGNIFLGGHGGVRYQYKEKLGFFVEGGTPFSTIGITFKL
jgi:hypothetical protein